MFTQVAAQKAADWLVQGGAVEAERREIYEFGLDKLFSTFINFTFVMFLGLILSIPLQALIFYCSYFTIRIYAGGYHAEKAWHCFWASLGIMIPLLIALRFYQEWTSLVVFWSLLIVSAVTIVILGPVENKNKPLDDIGKRVFRRRMIRNLLVVVIGTMLFLGFRLPAYATAMLCGMVLTAGTATAGKVKLVKQG